MKPTNQEKRWLAHFASGERETPRGMGPQGVFNFKRRGWIIRIEREVDFGPELYRLTPEGVGVHERENLGQD